MHSCGSWACDCGAFVLPSARLISVELHNPPKQASRAAICLYTESHPTFSTVGKASHSRFAPACSLGESPVFSPARQQQLQRLRYCHCLEFLLSKLLPLELRAPLFYDSCHFELRAQICLAWLCSEQSFALPILPVPCCPCLQQSFKLPYWLDIAPLGQCLCTVILGCWCAGDLAPSANSAATWKQPF